MGIDRGAAGGIRHYIDLVARLQRHQRRESQADFGPQSGDHQLFTAGRFHRCHKRIVFPGVHGGTFNRLDVRMHGQ